MPGLRRPTPAKQVLELTRRLAEEYDTLPLAEVSHVVQQAVTTTNGQGDDWSGTRDGIPAVLEVIEILARESLDASVATQRSGATTAPSDPAPTAAPRSKRRRGAA
jgi:hypothetical protein